MTSELHLPELDRVRQVYEERAATDYGDRYTHFNPGNLYLVQDRERLMLRVLRHEGLYPLAPRDILDVGCGTGYWLRQFVHWGADPARIVGVELDATRVAEARRLLPQQVKIHQGDAAATGLPDAFMDAVHQSVVFTSILDADVRRALAREMMRVLRPGGVILWYDFRYDNPSNPNVRGIGRGEIRELFPSCEIRCRTVSLAPFLARRVAPVSRLACELLQIVPPLRTHIQAVIRRSGAVAGGTGA